MLVLNRIRSRSQWDYGLRYHLRGSEVECDERREHGDPPTEIVLLQSPEILRLFSQRERRVQDLVSG